MREILFRGKRLDNGEWVEGGLFIQTENDLKEYAVYIMTSSLMNVCNANIVDPSTVGQYTGLKDKNGKRIFEGDIVQIKDFTHGCALNYKQPTSKWVVHWREDTARFCIDYMSVLPFDFTKSEVIGNIHDTPELLGGCNG